MDGIVKNVISYQRFCSTFPWRGRIGFGFGNRRFLIPDNPLNGKVIFSLQSNIISWQDTFMANKTKKNPAAVALGPLGGLKD
jgi:hypothetical protein